MLGWFKKKPKVPLAPAEEREALLAQQHPIFREVDAAFHALLEIVTANPRWEDSRIEREMVRRGVEAELAEECIAFGPMAWGRDVVEQLGVTCSPHYRLRSLIDGAEREMPLAMEPAYAWAREMIGLYRTEERNEVFTMVSLRSAELNAINNALHDGLPEEDLRKGTMQPTLVHLRRTIPPEEPVAGELHDE